MTLKYLRKLVEQMEQVGMSDGESFIILAEEGAPAIVHQNSGRYTHIWREQQNSLGENNLVKLSSIDNMEQID